ncbi:Aste57867_1352 [Aphanomyces stellatus]|uniref:Aste57867_1352 protein n=1 Tax=Aphanomyces stellatus TaxID=120398 RepID=A0A485K8C5_9STRA|nr:hypothetical protein As57867_001351 [Aphanomyces stellatus]VFT78571.1 Aste57867_1352 [Aphanomyces stellatus]
MKWALVLSVLLLAPLAAEHVHDHNHGHKHSEDLEHGHSHGHSGDSPLYSDHAHAHHHDHTDEIVGADRHDELTDGEGEDHALEVRIDEYGRARVHKGYNTGVESDQHDDDHGHSHDHKDLRIPIPGPLESKKPVHGHSHDRAKEDSGHTHDHSHHHAKEHESHSHDHSHHHVNDLSDHSHGPSCRHSKEHGGHSHDHSHHHANEHSGHTHDHGHHHATDHAGHSHDHGHASDFSRQLTALTSRFEASLWSEALFATALVGLAPVILLWFIPLGRANLSIESQKPLLRIFLSFAAGGLLGDALLHLLPHSLPSGGHDHEHDHNHGEGSHSHSVEDLAPYLWTLAGLMTFLMLEKFVRAQTGEHGHSHGHSHGPSHERTAAKQPASKTTASKDEEVPKPTIAAAGYLNLAADFSHNFTDGLAIGATFVHGRSSGWQTTVAMLLHEVPHEIGDFAILIQSGFTRSEAMWTQVYTAVGAMVGTAVGLMIETQTAAWITPFTAGGFVYIACTSVFPELLEDSSLLQSILQLAAMSTGVALMLLIALYE